MNRAQENHAVGRHKPARAHVPFYRNPNCIDPVILLALVLAFFWKLAFTRQYSFIANPDLADQVLPWLQMQAIALHNHHTIALWDPFVYFGQSLIGQVQPAVTSPFTWLLIAAPLDNGHLNLQILNLWFVLIHYFAAVFAWLFFRDLGLSRAASITGALFYAIAGYVGTTMWTQMVSAAIWAPLVFMFLLRSLRGQRPQSSAAFAGFFLGIAWLCGHHQQPLYISLAAIAVPVYLLFSRWEERRQIVSRSAIFVLVTGLTSLLQTLPAAEYARLSVRWISTGPLEWNQSVPFPEHEMYSFRPADLAHFVLPGGSPHTDPIVGVVGAIVAVLAMMALFHRFEVRLFALIGLATLLLSMARNDVVYGLFYILVPLIEKSREPVRWLSVTHFCIAVLVAFGAEVFLDRLRAPLIARAARWAGIFALVTFSLWFLIQFLKPTVASVVEGDDRPLMLGLIAAMLAGLFIARSRDRIGDRGAAVCLIALMAIELGNSNGYYNFVHKSEEKRWEFVKSLSEGEEIAKFLRAQPVPLRASVSRDDLPVNFGDQYGIETVEGYLASMFKETFDMPWWSPRLSSMLGINYVVGRKPPPFFAPFVQDVYTAKNGIKVFRNPDAFPRAWTVHRATQVEDRKAVDFVANGTTDLRNEAVVSDSRPSLETCPESDQVSLVQEWVQATDIDVTMACRGMMVVSDSWYPGWVARVDGTKTDVLKVNGAVRGVVVEKGRHHIHISYRPMSVFLGFAGALAGAAAVLFLWRRPEHEGRDLIPA